MSHLWSELLFINIDVLLMYIRMTISFLYFIFVTEWRELMCVFLCYTGGLFIWISMLLENSDTV